MALTKYHETMLATKQFGLKGEARNAVFGRLIAAIINDSLPIHEINLVDYGLNRNALEILAHAFECNPRAAARLERLHLDVSEWFPFRMPSFSQLKNLKSLTIKGERCPAFFDPLDFPQLEEFSLSESGINLEQFPDLLACKRVQKISVAGNDIRYPEEFKIPGIDDARNANLAAMQTIFPQLTDFNLTLENGCNWNRYLTIDFKRMVLASL